MAVKMLTRGPDNVAATSASKAVREAIRRQYSEYISAPTEHGTQASELARKIREIESHGTLSGGWTVRGRRAQPSLFK